MEDKMNGKARQMEDRMNGNARQMTNEMKEEINKTIDGMTQTMRGEMQQIGRGLQAATARIVAIARSEARTTAGKMVTPRAATNELEGSAPAGEDRAIRETCRTRHEVTGKKN